MVQELINKFEKCFGDALRDDGALDYSTKAKQLQMEILDQKQQ